MLLALVDDEPAVEALDLPLVDEEMDCELMGREEVELLVAIEFPAPNDPTSDERIDHGFTHLPCQFGATSVSELVGEKTFMCHDHKTSQAHPSSIATTAS